MSIAHINELKALREQIVLWRQNGERIALVPTMGNLHAGHVQLAKQAKQCADRVIATIFVNPTQFGPGEDLDSYPKTLEADQEKLDAVGVDLLFAPSTRTVYPNGNDDMTFVEPPKSLANILCGAFRPGHFRGVATVVNKLFQMTKPDVALFGAKDYQQVMVIRRMVEDFNMDVEIVSVPTVREVDGLAMSSRNQYLSEQERRLAPMLFRVLNDAAQRLQQGTLMDDVECQSIQALDQAGFKTDYVSVRAANTLSDPMLNETQLVILAAANLGKARLIDNLTVNLNDKV